MNELQKELLETAELAENELAQTQDLSALETLRVHYLGRKGRLPALSAKLGKVPAAEKPAVGKTLNQVKNKIQGLFEQKTAELQESGCTTAPGLDLSLPGRRRGLGRKHPITRVMDEAVAIFRRMGFIVADGPDIEDVWHNFDALNSPPEHPSRTPEDTFYFNLQGDNWLNPETKLLRTQTSPVQIRVMQSQKPPLRIICPGRCYRPDTPDATHGMSFHQIEGLYVDKNVSLADLKGVLAHYAKEMFGNQVEVRLRPHYFPFTEPSVECDASCIICAGQGCRVCKGSGWLEIAGAGMVNPAVFENVGYDPEEYSGYAFGMGLERIAMIRYAINDLRLLYENDLRFLHQF
ncbi:MAG: phenylalanine--tRNA ligase subunit alpha [Lentisphaeria bacterium]|nr:phenylalanine--tRNA ligase subunit alpha [Lentisphaeria bacterium]NLZ60983.1 phenylalanine--tRNA ligase subunit alpha [Lentisphaerota bacterium]